MVIQFVQRSIMRVQLTTVYLLWHSLFVAADDIFNEGSILRTYNTRQYKNNGITMYEDRSPAKAPIEYLKTPNFDVMLLSEENSDPTWRKYSQLFQPTDLQNAPQIEVNYGGHEGFPKPYIRLDRSEVESVLALLGSKKHIIVLHQRNCKPDSTIRGAIESSLDEFENEFLPKLLQHLYKQNIGSETTDPVVDRILAMLDRDEQKMIDDLRQTFEGGYATQLPEENQMYSNGYTNTRRKSTAAHQGQLSEEPPMYLNSFTATRRKPISNHQYRNGKSRSQKKAEPKSPLKNALYNDPCNEGYVFLVQNQKNILNPSALNDLLLRVLKVVTESS